jgi:hypothetical protein
MDQVLELLKTRYATIAIELEAIKGDHLLNGPEVKAQDGGTTILKTAKIKQLEESLKAAAKAIKDHLDLQDVLDAGGEPLTFTIESQLGL